MGCDVHAYVEVNLDGQWHHLREINVDRDYELFSLMGLNKRGRQTAIASLRGLPSDVNAVTKLILDSPNYHSQSYLTSKEIGKLVLKKKKDPDLYYSNLDGYYESLWVFDRENIPESRLVFGFDS